MNGTRNVLSACLKASTVERDVVTSSMAAITDEPESDHVLTEADWNTKSTLERNAYDYSKTRAEKAAWELVTELGLSFRPVEASILETLEDLARQGRVVKAA